MQLLSENKEIVFEIVFGDENVFYYGKGEDGYWVRFRLIDQTKPASLPFWGNMIRADLRGENNPSLPQACKRLIKRTSYQKSSCWRSWKSPAGTALCRP